jgi:16S rRNA (cytosine967-C5)-methyltransferase
LSGLPARRFAVALIESVVGKGTTLDEALNDTDPAHLEPRDRAFARLLATTVLRRFGTLDAVLGKFLEKPLPTDAQRARLILHVASAQLLLLGTPPHAAINLAVEHCRRDRLARRFDKLANAVLRRVASKGPAILAELDTPRTDIPEWLWQRWSATYGEATTRRIAEASLREAALDISVKDDAMGWAEKLGGHLLPTGSIRLAHAGRIEELPGYADGGWWVQDAAAALPARLLGKVEGLAIADLCAAPGGKTAQLAAARAHVTAVDSSSHRLTVLQENLARLSLGDSVSIVQADLETWTCAGQFDAVLLDAPCTATGTLRRHPDILHLKRTEDVTRLAALQRRLLARAVDVLKPGGTLVYCTCSLEPEECEQQIEPLLATKQDLMREPVRAVEIGGLDACISSAGDLRTLPFHLALEPPQIAGMDGFYAARLRRLS